MFLAAGRPPLKQRRSDQMRLTRTVAAGGAIIAAAAIAVASGLVGRSPGGNTAGPAPQHPVSLPHRSAAYLGVYAAPAPKSYAGVTAFTASTGVRPGLVLYYSGWREPFQVSFAAAATRHHAIPLVQIDPTDVSLAAIASGRYDAYLRSYASAVKAFGARVILSFGQEMNGIWYSWGYRHVAPAVFVAAWRHIVTMFRHQGADNVTWLWTVNVIHKRGDIPAPGPWWPGDSYVTWVGIDGYYYKPSWKFASLFGPTIKAVRRLTLKPILISETAAAPAAGQPAKIADLIAGIRAYGLLGFVWFNVNKKQDWHLSSPASIAAFAQSAKTFQGAVP
jgi:mannan endo-1,4-beta-mannosidase